MLVRCSTDYFQVSFHHQPDTYIFDFGIKKSQAEKAIAHFAEGKPHVHTLIDRSHLKNEPKDLYKILLAK